jgi:hypothetical protein
VVLCDPAVTSFAKVFGGLGLALFPAPLELEPLHVLAVRARNEIAPLIARLEFALDAREAANGRCGHHENLCSISERSHPRLGERDRVPFALDIAHVGIDFVEKQPP